MNAWATSRAGFERRNLGDTAGFIASYQKALAIREAVLRSEPGNVQAERELLRTHGRLSDALMAAGDLNGSVNQLKQLLPIAEKLSAADPNNLTNRRNLALAYLDYGWKRAPLGDSKGSLEDCRRAVGMLESVSASDPSDKRTRRVLALAYGRVGELLSTYGGQHAESLAMHQKALAMEGELLRQDPRNTDLGRLEAWDTMRTGEEISASGDVEQALVKYRAALSHFRALSDADPKNIQFHSDLAAVLARMGAAHLAQAKAAEALAELKRSLTELENFAASAGARYRCIGSESSGPVPDGQGVCADETMGASGGVVRARHTDIEAGKRARRSAWRERFYAKGRAGGNGSGERRNQSPVTCSSAIRELPIS